MPNVARNAAARALREFISPPLLTALAGRTARAGALGRELVYPDMIGLSKPRFAVPIEPIGPGTEDHQGDDPEDRHGVLARRTRRPRPWNIKGDQQPDERPPREGPDAVLASSRPHIERDPASEHQAFDRERCRYRLPQAQAQLHAAPGVKRHVRAVADEIEQPMARYDERHPSGAIAIA